MRWTKGYISAAMQQDVNVKVLIYRLKVVEPIVWSNMFHQIQFLSPLIANFWPIFHLGSKAEIGATSERLQFLNIVSDRNFIQSGCASCNSVVNCNHTMTLCPLIALHTLHPQSATVHSWKDLFQAAIALWLLELCVESKAILNHLFQINPTYLSSHNGRLPWNGMSVEVPVWQSN